MDDIHLAQRAVSGDRESLALLIERYRAMLFRVAYGELRIYEDAQDAVAEAIVRACKFSSRLKQPDKFAAWIRTLARNEARRIAKRNAQAISRAEEQSIYEYPPRNELQQVVRDAMMQLPTDLAQVAVRFYLHEESVREIAARLERPEGTIKWMLARSRAKLADILKKDFTMTPPVQSAYCAVLIAPDLPTTEQQAIGNAVKAAGWDDVQIIADPAQALAFNGSVPGFLNGQSLVILDEQIGTTSAFELIPLLVAARKQGDFAVGLLLRGGRSEAAKNVAVMAAYVSGLDFLLTHPLTLGEVTSLSAQIRKQLAAKAG